LCQEAATFSSRSREIFASRDRGIDPTYKRPPHSGQSNGARTPGPPFLLIGHQSANSAATHVLRQNIAWLRDQLIATKAPYVITVAGGVGYALCKIAEEPRRISTSRSATLPELGRNLRRVRTAAGLTQTALAKRSGTARSYVSGLEAGQRNPTAVTLQRLAKVLGVTPMAFFQ
jgi:DNA-binding XRE family transcriptional regulator